MVQEAVQQTLRPRLHVMVYGAPGAGKSTLIASAEKPILVCFFDAVGKDPPYLRCGPGQEFRDEWGTRITRIQAPDGIIDVEYYNDINPKATNAWERFRYRMEQRAFVDQGYKTLAMDSVTFMELAARRFYSTCVNPGFKSQWDPFNAATDYLEDILIVHTIDLQMNVIASCHVSTKGEDVGGQLLRSPSAPGRLEKKQELPAGYGELYRAHVVPQADGTPGWVLQTQSNGTFYATTQIDAPNPCWNNWESLWSNWK
jgi:hypothetical protein